MTKWLRAARAGGWRTDTLTELTEPVFPVSKDAETRSQERFRQYCQCVSTAPIGGEEHASSGIQSAGSAGQSVETSMSQPAPARARPSQDEPYLDTAEYCRTWTGRVVSLDEWHQLSAWDRHGPAGRPFCGLCWGWVSRDEDCRQSGCRKAEGGVA